MLEFCRVIRMTISSSNCSSPRSIRVAMMQKPISGFLLYGAKIPRISSFSCLRCLLQLHPVNDANFEQEQYQPQQGREHPSHLNYCRRLWPYVHQRNTEPNTVQLANGFDIRQNASADHEGKQVGRQKHTGWWCFRLVVWLNLDHCDMAEARMFSWIGSAQLNCSFHQDRQFLYSLVPTDEYCAQTILGRRMIAISAAAGAPIAEWTSATAAVNCWFSLASVLR